MTKNEGGANDAARDGPTQGQDTPGGYLIPGHADYLVSCAIDPERALARGVRSIERADQLPAELEHCAAYVPGILFPWKMVRPVPSAFPVVGSKMQVPDRQVFRSAEGVP